MTNRAVACVFAIVAAAAFRGAAVEGAQGREPWKVAALASFDLAWQTINDTFYDPAFGGLDWDGVRAALRPDVERADSPAAARAVLRDMLARLGRSHFTLITAPSQADRWPGPARVPIEVRAFDRGVLVTKVAADSSAAVRGLRPGDVIVAIDGLELEDAARVGAPALDDRRDRLDRWQRAFRALHGPVGSVARLEVRSPGESRRDVLVERALAPGETVVLGNLPPLTVRTDVTEVRSPEGRRVGVIAFSAWMTAIAAPVAAGVDRFRHADGLIFDLRGNPGGLAEMIRGIAGHVLTAPDLLGRMEMRGVTLEMRANPRRSTSDGRRVEPYGGPLALLVDDMTASASECFAGGLQSLGRARVFGSRTAGQALPASTRALPSGDVLMYAVGDFVTSTGVALERDGVVPDVEVDLGPDVLKVDADPVLTAALRWIDDAR